MSEGCRKFCVIWKINIPFPKPSCYVNRQHLPEGCHASNPPPTVRLRRADCLPMYPKCASVYSPWPKRLPGTADRPLSVPMLGLWQAILSVPPTLSPPRIADILRKPFRMRSAFMLLHVPLTPPKSMVCLRLFSQFSPLPHLYFGRIVSAD